MSSMAVCPFLTERFLTYDCHHVESGKGASHTVAHDIEDIGREVAVDFEPGVQAISVQRSIKESIGIHSVVHLMFVSCASVMPTPSSLLLASSDHTQKDSELLSPRRHKSHDTVIRLHVFLNGLQPNDRVKHLVLARYTWILILCLRWSKLIVVIVGAGYTLHVVQVLDQDRQRRASTDDETSRSHENMGFSGQATGASRSH